MNPKDSPGPIWVFAAIALVIAVSFITMPLWRWNSDAFPYPETSPRYLLILFLGSMLVAGGLIAAAIRSFLTRRGK